MLEKREANESASTENPESSLQANSRHVSASCASIYDTICGKYLWHSSTFSAQNQRKLRNAKLYCLQKSCHGVTQLSQAILWRPDWSLAGCWSNRICWKGRRWCRQTVFIRAASLQCLVRAHCFSRSHIISRAEPLLCKGYFRNFTVGSRFLTLVQITDILALKGSLVLAGEATPSPSLQSTLWLLFTDSSHYLWLPYFHSSDALQSLRQVQPWCLAGTYQYFEISTICLHPTPSLAPWQPWFFTLV